jgi:hypothetical protein
MTDEELRYYAAALNEIYRLRCALAAEAETHAGNLTFKTFPKSRRAETAASVVRMKRCAIGEQPERHKSLSTSYLAGLLSAIGGRGQLTRTMWEQEVDLRGHS